MTANKNTTLNNSEAVILDEQTCQQLSLRVAYKALTTIYDKSGIDFIRRLRNGLYRDYKLLQSLNLREVLSDGIDLMHDCFEFLWGYKGHNLYEVIAVNRKGNPVDILNACFKHVNTCIKNMAFVSDTVPFDDKFSIRELVLLEKWDTEITYGDLPEIEDIIQSLGLNDRQRKVIAATFATEGSKSEIADAVGISVSLVYKSRQQVATKLLLKRPAIMLDVLGLSFRQKYVLRLRLKMLGKSVTFDGIFDTDEKTLRYMVGVFGKSAIPDMQSISKEEIVDTLSLIRERARRFFVKH